jgi:hypothetical protein
MCSAIGGLLVLSAGCVDVTYRNVSHDKRYSTDYIVGGKYQLQQTLVIRKIDDHLDLCPPGKNSDLSKIADEQHQPYSNFVGLLPSGTLLVISKIELEKRFLSGNYVWVLGRILEGPFNGKVVNLTFISKQVRQTNVWAYLPYLDTNMLRYASEP